MFANQQIEIRVIGHPVALVRRARHLFDALSRAPASSHVSGHVRKQEILFNRMPKWPFGEGKAGADLAHRGGGRDQVGKAWIGNDMGHGNAPYAGNQLRAGRLSTTGPGHIMPRRPTT